MKLRAWNIIFQIHGFMIAIMFPFFLIAATDWVGSTAAGYIPILCMMICFAFFLKPSFRSLVYRFIRDLHKPAVNIIVVGITFAYLGIAYEYFFGQSESLLSVDGISLIIWAGLFYFGLFWIFIIGFLVSVQELGQRIKEGRENKE